MEVRQFTFPRAALLVEPFTAYQKMVKRRFSDVKLARSHQDYMMALYLRCAGHSGAEVGKELTRHLRPGQRVGAAATGVLRAVDCRTCLWYSGRH